MTDFSHLLKTNADDVKEQPVLPIGQYLAIIGQFEFKEMNTKDGPKPVVAVPVQLRSRLAGEGQLPTKLPVMTQNFFLTNQDGNQDEHTLNPIKVFCQSCGIDTEGKSIGQALSETVNAQVAVDIIHNPNPKNPSRPYSNIKSFAAA